MEPLNGIGKCRSINLFYIYVDYKRKNIFKNGVGMNISCGFVITDYIYDFFGSQNYVFNYFNYYSPMYIHHSLSIIMEYLFYLLLLWSFLSLLNIRTTLSVKPMKISFQKILILQSIYF